MRKQFILISFLSVLLLAAPADAQTNFFTYQGSLKDGANAANGNYDFEFRVFDAATNGNAVGGLITVTNRAVSNGVFSVDLLFGSGTFDGSDRYIDVRVRPTGVGSYIALAPRQRVNSVPYALRSLAATTATTATTATNALQLGGVAANQYVTSTSGNLPAGDSSYVQNRTSVQTGSNFNISGSGTANTFAATQFNGGSFSGALFSGSLFNSTNGFYQDNVRILNTPGTNNTFGGRLSGSANSGTDNTFFGFNTGNNNTSAVNNTFVGSEAGSLNTTGDVNTFIGSGAGKNNNIGSDNAFVGTAAGLSNSSGNQNIFVGRSAGRLNVGGSANTFVGFEAGRATNNSFNSFFGHQSGDTNTVGTSNSFFGASAGGANVDGNSNAFFGRDAGLVNVSGDNNSFFGRGAGDLSTGSNNTFIGTDAGNTNTTGGSNTAIGQGADMSTSGLDHATAIGAGAVVSNSNSVVLGRSTDTVRIPGTVRLPNIGFLSVSLYDWVCVTDSGLLFKCDSTADPRLCVTDGLAPGDPGPFPANNPDRLSRCTLPPKPNESQTENGKSDKNYLVLANTLNEQRTRIDTQNKELAEQRKTIAELKTLVCAGNATASVCKP